MNKRQRSTTKKLSFHDAPKVARSRRSSGDILHEEVALLRRERDEALEQQKATAEVLRVISSVAGELEPVFSSILDNAVRICEANYGILFSYAAGTFYPAAQHDVPKAYADFNKKRGAFRAPRESTLDRIERTKQIIVDADISKKDPSNPAGQYAGRKISR
jgi:hypothetical protein